MAEDGPMPMPKKGSNTIFFNELVTVTFVSIKLWDSILYRPDSCTPGLASEEDVTDFHRSVMEHCGYDGLRVTREDVIERLVRDYGFRVLEPIRSQVED